MRRASSLLAFAAIVIASIVLILLIARATQKPPDLAMPMHHLTQRVSLVACDTCDAVMTVGGETAPKRYRESDPTDLASHYATPAELRATARASGWLEDDGAWTCPRCSRPPAP